MPPKMPILAAARPAALRRRFARGLRVARDVADERGDGRVHGLVGPAGPDAGGEDVVDDPEGVDVRDLVLEAVADLDPDLAVLGQDEQHEPVVDALAADLPGLERPDRPVLERGVRADRPADPDEDLVAGLALISLEARVEPSRPPARERNPAWSVAQRSGAGGIRGRRTGPQRPRVAGRARTPPATGRAPRRGSGRARERGRRREARAGAGRGRRRTWAGLVSGPDAVRT